MQKYNDVMQWSPRKTLTTGTPSIQAEIGPWCKHRLGRFCRDSGVSSPGKKIEIYAKSCNLVHFWPKMVRNFVHNAFLNPTRSPSKWLPTRDDTEIWNRGGWIRTTTIQLGSQTLQQNRRPLPSVWRNAMHHRIYAGRRRGGGPSGPLRQRRRAPPTPAGHRSCSAKPSMITAVRHSAGRRRRHHNYGPQPVQ